MNQLRVWLWENPLFFLQTWLSPWYAGFVIGFWRISVRVSYTNREAEPEPEPLDEDF